MKWDYNFPIRLQIIFVDYLVFVYILKLIYIIFYAGYLLFFYSSSLLWHSFSSSFLLVSLIEELSNANAQFTKTYFSFNMACFIYKELLIIFIPCRNLNWRFITWYSRFSRNLPLHFQIWNLVQKFCQIKVSNNINQQQWLYYMGLKSKFNIYYLIKVSSPLNIFL